MTTLDIRKAVPKVDRIRVSGMCSNAYVAELLVKKPKGFYVQDSSNNSKPLLVENLSHARHLIKALEEAIKLGWV